MIGSWRGGRKVGRVEPSARSAPQTKAFGRELNGIEGDVAAVWAPVLGRDVASVGANDNFFERGGSAERAAELLRLIEEEFGARLPADQLTTTPTLAGLALEVKALTRLTFANMTGPVQLAAGDPGLAPVFCVAAMGGTVLPWRRTAGFLDARIPVFATESVGLDRRDCPLERIEDIADLLIVQMRALIGRSPVVLCGHSFGGRVAYEMACRLEADGQEVAGLVLLDVVAARRLDREIWTLRRLPALARGRVRVQRKAVMARIALRSRRLGLFLPKDAEHRVRWIIHAQRIAWRRHKPRPYGGDMTLLTVDSDARRRDEWLGWRRLVAGQIELRDVPGEHRGMLGRESASSTGAVLDECFLHMTERAGDRTSAS